MHKVPDDSSGKPVEDTLYDLLLAGQGREARGLIFARFLAGDTVAALADGPIRSAMHKLGELWKHDARGASSSTAPPTAAHAGGDRAAGVVDSPDDGPVAVGGAPAGDIYLLPSLLATTVLLASEGLRAINLGPDTPMAAMRHAIAAHQPAMVWLSCSVAVNEAQAVEIAALAKSLRQGGATLVVGGRHVGDVAVARAAYPVASMGDWRPSPTA